MKNGLLVVERMVLEALVESDKELKEIACATGLNELLLANILSNLLIREIIIYQRGQYQLNLQKKEQWLPVINSPQCLKEEIRELFAALVNRYFSREQNPQINLRVKKIWMSKTEEKIFNAHLYNLEEFLKGVEKNRGENLAQKKVVIWGHSDYSEILDSSLEAV